MVSYFGFMNSLKLAEILVGEPKYRREQINKIIYKDLLTDWAAASVLPANLRSRLKAEVPLEINARLIKSSEGATIKALVTLADGLQIEAVLMRYEDGRNTACISSQVGCPLSCTFCATGSMGFKRNLTAEEIVEQVLLFERHLKPLGQKITNVVFMGMGEPFLNYENVVLAVRQLNDPERFNLGARKISVSTAGIPDLIRKFADDLPECNLAISLHSATSSLRSKIMPINNAYDLSKVLDAVDYYIALTNRKVMFEYILIDGVNDSLKDAEALSQIANGRLVHVNLIPYNPTGIYKPPTKERLQDFRLTLKQMGVSVTQRFKYGTDINAACGQLAIKGEVTK